MKTLIPGTSIILRPCKWRDKDIPAIVVNHHIECSEVLVLTSKRPNSDWSNYWDATNLTRRESFLQTGWSVFLMQQFSSYIAVAENYDVVGFYDF